MENVYLLVSFKNGLILKNNERMLQIELSEFTNKMIDKMHKGEGLPEELGYRLYKKTLLALDSNISHMVIRKKDEAFYFEIYLITSKGSKMTVASINTGIILASQEAIPIYMEKKLWKKLSVKTTNG